MARDAAITIRSAGAADAGVVAQLMGELGYPIDVGEARARLSALAQSHSDPVFLAIAGEVAVGLVALHITRMLQWPWPVARVTALVVAAAARGQGAGRLLLDHARSIARERRCGLIELTSGTQRAEAHAFYEANGFATTSRRFHRLVD